jgi:hypothetical protein
MRLIHPNGGRMVASFVTLAILGWFINRAGKVQTRLQHRNSPAY